MRLLGLMFGDARPWSLGVAAALSATTQLPLWFVCLFVFTPDTSKLGSGLRLGIEVELEWQVEVG